MENQFSRGENFSWFLFFAQISLHLIRRRKSERERESGKLARRLDSIIRLTIDCYIAGKMLSEQKMSMKLLMVGAVLLIAAVKGESLFLFLALIM